MGVSSVGGGAKRSDGKTSAQAGGETAAFQDETEVRKTPENPCFIARIFFFFFSFLAFIVKVSPLIKPNTLSQHLNTASWLVLEENEI